MSPLSQRLLLVSLVLLFALGVGCRQPTVGRVLVVGIDGASPRVLEPMLRQGRLPTLGRLVGHGAYGELESTVRPLVSPVIWATVATGKVPERHGIQDFVRSDEEGRRYLYQSTDRTSHALWNIASTAELSLLVVNWWTTFPPEITNGVVVSDYALPGMVQETASFVAAQPPSTSPAVTYPARWALRVRAWIDAAPSPTEPETPFVDPKALPDGLLFPSMEQQFVRDLAIARVVEGLEDELRPDVSLALLVGIDRVSHFLWRYVEPEAYAADLRPAAKDVAPGRALLERYYEITDALLARLVAPYDLERDLVIVLSDHGFEPGEAYPITGRHKSQRAARGILVMAGGGLGRGATMKGARSLDITPTILTWLGIPLGLDMDGRPLAELFPDDARFTAPPPPIATHDVGPIRTLDVENAPIRSVIQEELRSLGYLE